MPCFAMHVAAMTLRGRSLASDTQASAAMGQWSARRFWYLCCTLVIVTGQICVICSCLGHT